MADIFACVGHWEISGRGFIKRTQTPTHESTPNSRQIDVLVQDCSIYSAKALEILQSCSRSSRYFDNKICACLAKAWDMSYRINLNFFDTWDVGFNSLRPSDVCMHQCTKSSLVQIMACCLRCQAIIRNSRGLIKPLGTSLSEFLFEIHIFIDENAFENVVCKMVAILSRLQCVKPRHGTYIVVYSSICRKYRARSSKPNI